MALTSKPDQAAHLLEAALACYVAELSLGRLSGDRLEAMLARLGLAGRPPVSCAEAGRRMGVSDERVRQIEVRMRTRSAGNAGSSLPAFDRAVELVAAHVPLPASDVERLLCDQEVAKGPFSHESLVAAATFLGPSLPFTTVGRAPDAVVVPVDEDLDVVRLHRVARRLVGLRGAATVAELCAELAREGHAADRMLTTAVLAADEGAEVKDGWYWFPGGTRSGSFVASGRRMLAVRCPLSVDTLRDGLARRLARGHQGPPPPNAVLSQVYEGSPAFKVDEIGMVWSGTPLDRDETLGPVQRRIVEILEARPSRTMDRADLFDACRTEGINLNSVQWLLTYSECFERAGRGQIAPRGQGRESRRPARRPRRRAHGWTEAHQPWLAAEVDAAVLASGVLYVPAAIRTQLVGRRFTVAGPPGCGAEVGCGGKGQTWGWRSVLNEHRAEPGQVVRATFDVSEATVMVAVGGSELLDDSRSGR